MEKYNDLNRISTGYSRFLDLSDSKFLEPSKSFAKNLNINYSTLADYPNWTLINGNYCYVKRFNDNEKDLVRLIHELVGEEITKKFGLPTIHNEIFTENGEVSGLISKNFREIDKTYIDGYQMKDMINKNDCANILELINSGKVEGMAALEEDMIAYVVRNYFTSQKDRTNGANMIFSSDLDGTYRMGPLFDYECSLGDRELDYYIDILIKCNITDLKNSEFLRMYLNKCLSLDMRNIIEKIQDQRNIIIPKEIKEDLLDFTTERKNVLKKVL